ncbi:hypothetical protein PENSPDRAFT_101483 [Peniophora sp. CONT]|nr:hypothetical protein PENSPDRAFT_101483 [Peniophora sp. CONT]
MQVRLRAPMRQESARIAVKALVEVLKALELATKMVRRGRLRQFLHALFSKSDDVETALEKLEDVTTEEEKMTITELAIGMHGMAYQVQESK